MYRKGNKYFWLFFLLLIVVINALALFLFFRAVREDEAGIEVAEEVEEVALAEPGPEKVVDPATLPSPGAVPDNPNFGAPFTYRYAVSGDLPGLPGSKQVKAGILVDLSTRQVLWCKDPRASVRIASMTKMMTLLLALEKVAAADLSLDTMIKVTPGAMKIGGSQVWLDVRESFPLRDLLKCVAIHSANDAAELVAERLGRGSSAAFVREMNARARELRLVGTKYVNAHGLPGRRGADNVSSPEASAFLAERLLEYPEAVKWSSTWLDGIRSGKNKFQLCNRNKLVASCPGVDGMKTGFTAKAGYCVTATCEREGRRLVAVVTGFPSGRERNKFVAELFDWGYARERDLSVAGTTGGTVPK